MHQFVLDWGQQVINKYELADKSTLEIGSQNINGSLRQYFHGPYYGIDMQDGDGVDEVMNAHDMPGGWVMKYQCVVNTEVIEHDDKFWLTMSNIAHVLDFDGYLVMSGRGSTKEGYAMFEHDYPHDLWRFMEQGFLKLFEMASCEVLEWQLDTQHPGYVGIGKRI